MSSNRQGLSKAKLEERQIGFEDSNIALSSKITHQWKENTEQLPSINDKQYRKKRKGSIKIEKIAPKSGKISYFPENQNPLDLIYSEFQSEKKLKTQENQEGQVIKSGKFTNNRNNPMRKLPIRTLIIQKIDGVDLDFKQSQNNVQRQIIKQRRQLPRNIIYVQEITDEVDTDEMNVIKMIDKDFEIQDSNAKNNNYLDRNMRQQAVVEVLQEQEVVTNAQPQANSQSKDSREAKRLYNNFTISDDQEQKKSCRNKAIKIAVLTLFGLLIVGTVIGLAIHFTLPEPIRHNDYGLIVDRTYTKNEVFHLNYTINTQMSENYTIRINYTVYIVVLSSRLDQSLHNITNFISSIQKRSQEKISDNETIQETKMFDESTTYEDILKYGANGSLSDEDQNQTADSETLSCEQLQASSNQTIHCTSAVLSIFRFSLKQTGKIQKFTFPSKMERQVLGLLRTFVKMFSPLLERDLYDGNQAVSKRKDLSSSPLYSSQDNRTESDNFYEEQEKYTAQRDGEATVLTNQAQVNVQDDAQSTSEQSVQSSSFVDRRLTSSNLQSDIQFTTPQQRNQTVDDDIEYQAEPLNMDLNFSSHQQCQLEVIEEFIAEQEHVEQFESISIMYENKNETITVNVTGLINYILGVDEENAAFAGDYRLLIEKDGSLTLLKYDKKIKILSTNVIGFKLGAFGYLKLNLNLRQDPRNPYIKRPLFTADIGTILSLGFKQFSFSLLDYEKQLPPLTLKFTLEEIESVLNMVKGSFISEIIDLSKMIINGQFQQEMLPKILGLASTIGNLTNVIDQQASKNSPLATLNKIYQIVETAEEAFQTKGLSMLSSDNELATKLSPQIFKYVNITYEEALEFFEKTKDTLTGIRSNILHYLLEMKTTFLSQNITEISNRIQNLIPKDVYDKYMDEINKAKIILDTISYIQENSQFYKNGLETILEDHETNLLALVRNVADLFFDNQTNINNIFNLQQLEQLNNQLSQIQDFKKVLKYVKETTQKSEAYFYQIVNDTDIGSKNHRTLFSTLLDQATSYAKGASNQKYSGCCSWRRIWYTFNVAKECRYYNTGVGNQGAQPVIWSVTRQQIEGFVLNTTMAAEQFIVDATQMLNDSSISIPDKYMKLQQIYYSNLGRYPFNVTFLLEKIDSNLANSRRALSTVRCGGTGNLIALINKLVQIRNFVISYGEMYDLFRSTFDNVTQKFNVTIYNTIMDQSHITNQTYIFLENYEQYTNKIFGILNNLKDIARDFSPKAFVQDDKLTSQVFSLYGQLISSTKQQCQQKEIHLQEIQNIRDVYLSTLNSVEDMTNEPLAEQLDKFKGFLNSSSQNLFNTFLSTPFCSFAQGFSQNISDLYPDFDNFTVLFDLWKNFKDIKRNSKEQLAEVKSKWSTLTGDFYQLFTPGGFQNFIYSAENLTKSIVSITYNLSMNLSNIRETSKEVLVFKTATQNQLTQAFQVFVDSAFELDPHQMYSNITQLVEESLGIIKDLSFDVITAVVAGKNVIQYYQSLIQKFKEGVLDVKQQFLSLCQEFINLDRLVTQDYLNNIDQSFRGIMKTVNSTIFPNITQGTIQIQNKFNDYQFKNVQLRFVFKNTMKTLVDTSQLMEQARDNVYVILYKFADQIISLIDKLEIGSLNSLYQLGQVIKTQFKRLLDLFKQIIRKILDFPKMVTEDFHNLFKFSEIIQDIKKDVKSTFVQIDENIRAQINQTISYLQKNSEFYAKFENSQVHNSLKQLASNGLVESFDDVWSSSESIQRLKQIEDLIKSISGSLQQFLEKLSAAKNKIKAIKESVQGRIKQIKNQFSILKRKFTSLGQLIFITLSGDLSGVVMGSVKNILKSVDGIVDVDFYAIGQLADQQFEVASIKEVVDDAVQMYGKLKLKRQSFVENMHNGLIKVDKLIQNQLTSKVQKLKDGILFIKSQSNLQNPIQFYTLYYHQFPPKRQNIFQFKQVIPTAVGTFLISMELNYTLSAAIFIQLRQYRNVDIGANFTASLVLDVAFGYGLAYILEFGLYVKGNILRASVMPKFLLNGVIPYQLINAIAQIPEITNKNVISVDFVTDLQLYAIQMEVGFYIKHIWLQLIWLRIKFCVDFLFLHFCISFRIPIGFKIVWKRHDFGYKFRGIPLAKIRIIDLRLLEFKV